MRRNGTEDDELVTHESSLISLRCRLEERGWLSEVVVFTTAIAAIAGALVV